MNFVRQLPWIFACLFCMGGFAAEEPKIVEDPMDHGHALVVGKRSYLYHYAYFTHAHRYQFVSEVKVESEENGKWSPWVPPTTGNDQLYSAIVGGPDVMPNIAMNPASGRYHPIVLLKGFLIGGAAEKLPGKYRVQIQKAVHFRPLKSSDRLPEHYEYILFGNLDSDPSSDQAELYLAHVINGMPGFEQILRVKLEDGVVTPRELDFGPRVQASSGYPKDSTKIVEQRAQVGSLVSGTVGDIDLRQPDGMGSRKISLRVLNELFVEKRLMDKKPAAAPHHH